MCTKTEDYVEVVMIDVCIFMRWAMRALKKSKYELVEKNRIVVSRQLQMVLDVMDLALALFGPEVNKYYGFLQQLRADWIDLMEIFRAFVTLFYIDDELEVFYF